MRVGRKVAAMAADALGQIDPQRDVEFSSQRDEGDAEGGCVIVVRAGRVALVAGRRIRPGAAHAEHRLGVHESPMRCASLAGGVPTAPAHRPFDEDTDAGAMAADTGGQSRDLDESAKAPLH